MSFYSPIDKLMSQSTRPKGTGAEYMTELSKQPGFKQAEVEDRDLQALLALPKMDRAAFMAQLKAKPATQPREKVLKGDEETHHEEYTLPGGTNYREILLQHPKGSFPGVAGHFGGAPDVLASIRAKDRVGPNGEKILHIEEIQSDWHKQGSKKGYQPKGVDLNKEADKAKMQHTLLSQKLNEARQSSDAIDRNLASDQPLYQNPEVRERQKQAQIRHNESIMDLMPQVMKAEEAHRVALETARSAVPEAPFKKNWHELALKRMIHHAAEKGYHQIHITPGETQAERWGAEGKKAKGFHDLYNEQLPQFLNKFGKQYGSRVQPGQVAAGDKAPGYGLPSSEEFEQNRQPGETMLPYIERMKNTPNMAPTHRFDITPQMREDVLKNGMPLYAKGGEVKKDVSRETIKPVAHGIIKERVTVSPNLDAMQYELMSAKHFTKKVK